MSPHRRREVDESTQDPETAGSVSGPVGSKGPRVPKVSMGYLYMYTKGGTKKAGADALPTHEIRARLKNVEDQRGVVGRWCSIGIVST